MNRRAFLSAVALSSLALPLCAEEKRPRRVLLRSSWQTVNIGDIAHTPGVLRLLEEFLPEVEVRLWPTKVDHGVAEMLRRRFPRLTLVLDEAAVRAAFAECDFLLHGSGPSLVAEKDVARWHEETGKPYGVYGITLPAYPLGVAPSVSTTTDRMISVLSGARFAFFRDSVSLAAAKTRGCTCAVMEFCPDGAFAVDLRNDAAATKFLAAHDLEEGRFLCAIARLRYTPYWKIHGKPMKQQDSAPLREAIIAVVRQTGMKVLVCPEDESQMAVGRELLVDPLPDDVMARVVWREDFWLTDEALSTYVRSAGLFGAEMHSPIMAVGNGIPAIVCRWAEQTSKGIMWRDIGLGDWLFDLDHAEEAARVAPAVLALAKDPAAARARALKAREFVRQRQRETMEILRRELAVL
jgi:polysaccharide pyruvyl transferase WcaK-like protein